MSSRLKVTFTVYLVFSDLLEHCVTYSLFWSVTCTATQLMSLHVQITVARDGCSATEHIVQSIVKDQLASMLVSMAAFTISGKSAQGWSCPAAVSNIDNELCARTELKEN